MMPFFVIWFVLKLFIISNKLRSSSAVAGLRAAMLFKGQPSVKAMTKQQHENYNGHLLHIGKTYICSKYLNVHKLLNEGIIN